jgi:hypothetical protein
MLTLRCSYTDKKEAGSRQRAINGLNAVAAHGSGLNELLPLVMLRKMGRDPWRIKEDQRLLANERT